MRKSKHGDRIMIKKLWNSYTIQTNLDDYFDVYYNKNRKIDLVLDDNRPHGVITSGEQE